MEVPDWVRRRTRKWNRTLNFIANPCNATVAVYFETLRPAASKAMITLLSFDIDDVARGMFRPHGVYPKNHMGRKRRMRLSTAIPELGEEIGKRLPGAEGIKQRSFGLTEKRLWLFDGFTQRIFFWMMIADIVTDFGYDWVSGIYNQEFCNKAGTSTYLVEGVTFDSEPPPFTNWLLGSYGTVSFDQGTFGTFPHERSFDPKAGTQVFAQWRLSVAAGWLLDCDVILSSGLPAVIDRHHVNLVGPDSLELTLQVTSNGGHAVTLPLPMTYPALASAELLVFNIMQPGETAG